MTTPATVVLSGGLDSTVALALAIEAGAQVSAVSFDYAQRHRERELTAARQIAEHYRIPHRIIPMQGIMSGSSLTDPDKEVPHAGYDDESMASTVVHGRNLLFVSAAIAAAGAGSEVWLGVHGGDHHLYPDCRPSFWEGLRKVVEDAYGTEIVTPFLHTSKAAIVQHGTRLAAPLAMTYSCYEGGEEHCGECGTCRERREAFRLAGISDATRYAVEQ